MFHTSFDNFEKIIVIYIHTYIVLKFIENWEFFVEKKFDENQYISYNQFNNQIIHKQKPLIYSKFIARPFTLTHCLLALTITQNFLLFIILVFYKIYFKVITIK